MQCAGTQSIGIVHGPADKKPLRVIASACVVVRATGQSKNRINSGMLEGGASAFVPMPADSLNRTHCTKLDIVLEGGLLFVLTIVVSSYGLGGLTRGVSAPPAFLPR